jgi:hypothetical protein
MPPALTRLELATTCVTSVGVTVRGAARSRRFSRRDTLEGFLKHSGLGGVCRGLFRRYSTWTIALTPHPPGRFSAFQEVSSLQTEPWNLEGYCRSWDAVHLGVTASASIASTCSVLTAGTMQLHPALQGSYSFRRYASNAGRSFAKKNPRSRTMPSDERNGGKLGGGFNRVTRLKRAS